MSQIPTDNDDNRSVAASDFVQLDQPDEMLDQQEEQPQQQGQPQLGLHQSFWALDTESTHNNYENVLKEQKLMIEKLEANIQTLQEKVKNLELEAKIRTMEENAEHKANYQALEAKMNEVVQMLSTQNEEHRREMEQLKDGFAKEMEQLKSKNRKLEEKLMSNVEVPTTKNGALDAKMEQLQYEFSKKLVEQQKRMMEHIQAQSHFLEQKLKVAEQRAQTRKNELEEIIEHKMENFRQKMEKYGQQIGSNMKLDYMWSQLMVKSKILANPKGIVWDGSKTTKASISECGLKLNGTRSGWVFAIATEGYAISAVHCRKENCQFPGTIVYYYEVTKSDNYWYSSVGFTNGSRLADDPYLVGGSPSSYGIDGFCGKIDSLWLSGKTHKLECPTRPIAGANVFGCGLLLNSKNELAVFFTLNGILLEKQIQINPTVDRLYPTMSIRRVSAEANFGDNLVAKPFKFDTDKCPGLVFE